MKLVYKVVYTSLEKIDYKVVLVAPNSLAVNEAERTFSQTVGYKCKNIEIDDGHFEFICVPQKCSLEEYEVVNPKKICEENYHMSQDTIRLIDLETNVTNDERLALIECITNSIEQKTVEMEEICYFAGFKPENLDLTSRD